MSYLRQYTDSVQRCLRALSVTDRSGTDLGQDDGLDALCALSAGIRDAARKQYLCGNGASSAFANHMALDWTKNGGVPTHAFSDSALLTAMGNDLGYEEAFSAPLSWYAKSGDLLVTISSSGNSANILKTIEVARLKGMGVVTFSGMSPDNRSRGLGDLNLFVPAFTYGIVECAHQVLLHIWLDRFMGVEEWSRTVRQNMSKGAFQL